MKFFKMIYWATTLIMAILVITSIYLNFFEFDRVAEFYDKIGIPEWLIYPSAVFKILCLITIFSRKFDMLKEWAYALLFFNAVLAFSSHQIEQDGMGIYSFIAAMVIIISRIFEEKVFPEPTKIAPAT